MYTFTTQHTIHSLVPQYNSWIKVNEPPQPSCCYYGLAVEHDSRAFFGGSVPCMAARRAVPLLGIQACTIKPLLFVFTCNSWFGCGFETFLGKLLRFVLVMKWRVADVKCGFAAWAFLCGVCMLPQLPVWVFPCCSGFLRHSKDLLDRSEASEIAHYGECVWMVVCMDI